MSQHDYNIANQTFPATRTDLNNALGAVATNNSGNSQPATMFPNQWWFDSDDNKLYMRNKDNDAWVSILSIGATSDSVETIHCTSGNLTLDVVSDIILDSDSANWRFKDAGTSILEIGSISSGTSFFNAVSDADMHFKGNDGGTPITALYLDMSDSGFAYFNNYIQVSDRVVGSSNLILVSNDSNEKIQLDASGFIKFETNGAERMRINGDGNVGIGETAPLGKLHIKTADTGGSVSTNADELVVEGTRSGMTFLAANDNFSYINFGDDGGADRGSIRYGHSADSFSISTSATERMRFLAGGTMDINVGGGTNNTSDWTMKVRQTGNATATHYMIVFAKQNDTTVGSIQTDGSNTSFNTSSDYRLKENVIDLTGAIDRIKTLKPKRFNFKDNTNKTQDGFLAHEVTAVPEAVNGEKDATKTKEKVVVNADGNVIADGIEEADWVKGKSDILWTSDDTETQDILYTSDDVETQDILYTEEDELPEGVEVGDVKESATKSVGDVKEEATQTVGDVKTKAIYPLDSTWEENVTIILPQQLDQSKLVPLLTSALQEAITKIETLESKVATLEGE